eukprot:SAG11_NODE_7177_length_1183_cov_0.965867_1_plen_256_part_10
MVANGYRLNHPSNWRETFKGPCDEELYDPLSIDETLPPSARPSYCEKNKGSQGMDGTGGDKKDSQDYFHEHGHPVKVCFGGEKKKFITVEAKSFEDAGLCCDDHSADLDVGKLIGLIFGIIYLFCGIAIVCDDFFTASLEKLSIRFELSEDVAGATFMAAGSSAPELFTSLSSSLFADGVSCDNRGAVGIGTIVGSAIFNILIIIGATALLAGSVLQLAHKPLIRDTCFYAFSIALLFLFVREEPEKAGKGNGLVE